MKIALVFLCSCTLLGFAAGCSDKTDEGPQSTVFNPDYLETLEARFEELLAKWELDGGSEKAQEIRASYEKSRESRIELEKMMPEITKTPDYYKHQCEYLEAIIQLVELSVEKQPVE